jgi:prepilin-type N-terminal cleavage/methylation domain-containing protein
MRRNGFTLVELLLVIIIVAVLAAIAIPKVALNNRRSKEAALRYTLRQLRDAQDKFFQLYGAWPDDIEDFTDPNPTTTVWINQTTSQPWGTRIYQGPLLQQNQARSNHFILDPVSGTNFSVSRLANGSLRIRSSASGNDSRGVPYSSY